MGKLSPTWLQNLCMVITLSKISAVSADEHSSTSAESCPVKQDVFTRGNTYCGALVDDTSPPELWGIWTHRPFCKIVGQQEAEDFGKENKRTATTTDGKTATKFCVFTSSYFGTNGISIITRPEIASTVSARLFENYHSDFPGPSAVQNVNLKPAYKIVDMPEKGGKGVVATRHIPTLETFLVDYPSIIADATTGKHLTTGQATKLFSRSADQLADPNEVLGLSHNVPGRATGDEVGAILKTNNFLHEVGDWPQRILFPLISRINHGCLPNTFLRLSSNGLAAGITATRDIAPGDEITVSYIPQFDTSDVRQVKVREWGFSCSCALCSAPESVVAESDHRRREIAKIAGKLSKALQAYDMQTAKKIMEDGLQLLADEDMVYASGELHETLARIHWILGDETRSDEHARRVADYADFGLLEPRNRTAEIMGRLRAEG